MDGDEGPTPEAAYASTPRSPCPAPTESRLEASRNEAARGGACGPPSPTGRRSCNGGTPDLRLRRDDRAAAALLRVLDSLLCLEAEVESRSRSASSSCSTLIACLSADIDDANEREIGSRD